MSMYEKVDADTLRLWKPESDIKRADLKAERERYEALVTLMESGTHDYTDLEQFKRGINVRVTEIKALETLLDAPTQARRLTVVR